MSVCYYHNNEVIRPWASPAKKKNRFPAIAALAVLVLAVAAWAAYDWWLARNVALATVVVRVDTDGNGECDDRLGSGVVISPKGFILTTRDLVLDANARRPALNIEVVLRSGTPEMRRLKATIRSMGPPGASPSAPRGNFAVLEVRSPFPLEYVALLNKKNFTREEAVTAFGYPSAPGAAAADYGADIKVLSGVISNVDAANDGAIAALTETCKLEPGMEGGPLVQRGKLAAINTLQGAPNNIAVPIVLIMEDLTPYAGSEAR